MNIFRNIWVWVSIAFQSVMIRISLAMKNIEDDTLKADVNDLDERKKHQQVMKHRNPIAEKMVQGQKDERFVQKYYEVLKKADAYMRKTTPTQMEVDAEKWGMSYGKTDNEVKNVGRKKGDPPKKDRWGRRYEHFGFFDPKNKNYGKTLAQVLLEESVDRSKNDEDNYQIEVMFSNKPVELGLAETNIANIKYIKTKDESVQGLNNVISKNFPLSIIREKDVNNKIEELTEYVYVKRVSEEHKILEFYIPAKYDVFSHEEDSDIFKEIINIQQVWIYDEYKKPFGYTVKNYNKRIITKNEKIDDGEDQYHIIKINAIKIKNMN